MKPTFFANQSDFRKWLKKNHESETELLVGFYKVASGKPSMTWSESVDQALCFGWIDGIRRKIDEESYSIRFTPRRSTSIWSRVNIIKMSELEAKGLLHPDGITAFEKRKDHKSAVYAFENEPKELAEEFVEMFSKNAVAWAFYEKMPPYYKRTSAFWVMSAKKMETQLSRLNKLIKACENEVKLF
jgi:uncharacterized protein YdeI (YjbR/CyaY-like superfamily)